jgi:hypothetical protein
MTDDLSTKTVVDTHVNEAMLRIAEILEATERDFVYATTDMDHDVEKQCSLEVEYDSKLASSLIFSAAIAYSGGTASTIEDPDAFRKAFLENCERTMEIAIGIINMKKDEAA